jgi:hypothetical protein
MIRRYLTPATLFWLVRKGDRATIRFLRERALSKPPQYKQDLPKPLVKGKTQTALSPAASLRLFRFVRLLWFLRFPPTALSPPLPRRSKLFKHKEQMLRQQMGLVRSPEVLSYKPRKLKPKDSLDSAFTAIDAVPESKAKVRYTRRKYSQRNAAIRRYLWTGESEALEQT